MKLLNKKCKIWLLNKNNMFKKIFFNLLIIIGCFGLPFVGLGEMSSDNYSIYADSISVGGVFSTSTNYDLWDSIGEQSSGIFTSSTYEIRGGFQAMEKGDLSLIIDKSSFNLGDLSVDSVSSDSINFIISSDSDAGYVLAISDAGPAPITAVSDGEVTAGSEEYGFSVSGANAAFGDDRSIIIGRVLASSLRSVSDDLLTMTVKASRTSTTTYGDKNQNIVFNLSGNL